MKSSPESVALAKRLYNEVIEAIPGTRLYVKAVTTSSIYCKTPDGYSLRIGDHPGKEKYQYKWNLGPQFKRREWVHAHDKKQNRFVWRFYTNSV